MVFACGCSTSGGKYPAYSSEKVISAESNLPAKQASASVTHWNSAAAKAYLDERENWWLKWSAAKRDGETFCISCHTNLPFVFVNTLTDSMPDDSAENEKKIIADVRSRVESWDSVNSYYGDKDDKSGNGPGSRSTEAVLNAVILAFHDSRAGKLSEDTRLAFKNMWALQIASGSDRGSWLWQKFRLSPWESRESPYYGATLAALAIGAAPENYSSNREIQPNLRALVGYLRREYPDQDLLNRVGLLWASTKLPGLLTSDQQSAIVQDVLRKQLADGGWSLVSLTWSPEYFGIPSLVTTRRRNDWTPQVTVSDGMATSYVAFVLQQAGVPRKDANLQSAITWLIRNQNQPGGYWSAYSLNRQRDPNTEVGRFMTDAATAYAILALSQSGQS
jgi:squalene-hopene/tetraprenyl-beta-curcumene cyclase